MISLVLPGKSNSEHSGSVSLFLVYPTSCFFLTVTELATLSFSVPAKSFTHLFYYVIIFNEGSEADKLFSIHKRLKSLLIRYMHLFMLKHGHFVWGVITSILFTYIHFTIIYANPFCSMFL
jgi:hypothetical protein